MSSTVDAILQRAVEGERLTADEGVELLRSADLLALGRAADAVCKRLHPEPYRTYNIDRNINYTNVCAAVCDFCAFYRKVGDAEAYVLDRPVLLDKIRETVELGGDQILMQGGLHPELPFDWYLDLLRDIKAHFPQVNVHGFSPPEIYFFAKKFKMSLKEVLAPAQGGRAREPARRRRRDPGRPGPQGDHPGKVLTDGWLDVHRAWHELGGGLDGHDDVRPHRDAGGAGRAHGAGPPAPGRDRRPDRLHLLDLPARAHRDGRRPRRRARSSTSGPRPSRGSTSTTCPTSSRPG